MGQYSIVGLPLVLLLVTFCMRRSAACVESCQCNQTGTRWTCVGDGSDDPPVFSNNITIIRFLEISQYNISALRRDHVGDNPRLVRLLLNGNEIRSIEPGAFAGTSHLLWLSLNENSLREVDAHSFADLTMLKHLTLEGNEIETIGDSTFQSLGKLRRLDMSRNRIREITGATFGRDLPSVISLVLADNRIAAVTATAFAGMPRLRHLVLAGNPLQTLRIASDALEFLDASRCHLVSAPGGPMPRVRDVRAGENAIVRVRRGELAACGALESLQLTSNRIVDVADRAFSANRRLQRLWIDNNMLLQIPSDLSGTLTFLHLQQNNIMDIPPSILQNYTALKYLYLDDNWITRLSVRSFLGPSNLTDLGLSRNNITRLPAHAFAHLPNLRALDLSHAPLAVLEGAALSGLARLESLRLNDVATRGAVAVGNGMLRDAARLQRLELRGSPALAARVLADAASLDAVAATLATLDLRDTGCATLPRDLRRRLPRLLRLRLAGNPWRCDTALAPLLDWMRDARETTFDDNDDGVVCATPPELLGRPLAELSRDELLAASADNDNESATYAYPHEATRPPARTESPADLYDYDIEYDGDDDETSGGTRGYDYPNIFDEYADIFADADADAFADVFADDAAATRRPAAAAPSSSGLRKRIMWIPIACILGGAVVACAAAALCSRRRQATARASRDAGQRSSETSFCDSRGVEVQLNGPQSAPLTRVPPADSAESNGHLPSRECNAESLGSTATHSGQLPDIQEGEEDDDVFIDTPDKRHLLTL